MLSWIVMLGFFYWLFMLNLIFFVKCAKWLRYLQLEIPRVAISASGEKAFSRSYRVSSTNHMGYCQTMVKDQKKAFCGITRDRRLSETDVKERGLPRRGLMKVSVRPRFCGQSAINNMFNLLRPHRRV